MGGVSRAGYPQATLSSPETPMQRAAREREEDAAVPQRLLKTRWAFSSCLIAYALYCRGPSCAARCAAHGAMELVATGGARVTVDAWSIAVRACVRYSCGNRRRDVCGGA